MTVSVAVRPAGPGDADDLIALWIAAWQRTMPAIDFEARRGFIAGELAAAAGDGRRLLVAADDQDRPIGLMILEPRAGRIDQLAVASAAWGTGAAAALLAAARRLCPDGLTLTVNRDNPRAVRFYEKQGFVVVRAAINPTSRLPTLEMRRAAQPHSGVD